MKIKFSKFFIGSMVIAAALLTVSAVCRGRIIQKSNVSKIPKEAIGKKVVTLWLRNKGDYEVRKYEIDKFNKENKDDIYVDLKVYANDYFNLLRMSLATDTKPDIFQYGYYELVKDNTVMNLNELNLNKNSINDNNILYFNKKPMGIKLSGYNVKFVWNKDVFIKAGLNPDKPPKTLNELISYSKIIKKKCPEVTPFEFAGKNLDELKSFIGELSANQGPVYTSFWDYKTGKYDFDYSKDILKKLNYMSVNGLLPDDFDQKDNIDTRQDFYAKNAAMIVSTYEDKMYFSSMIPLDFSYGITDLPKLNADDSADYYYTEQYLALVVNKNTEHKKEVEKVIDWLTSDEVESGIMKSSKTLSFNKKVKITGGVMNGYDLNTNFSNEKLDPTNYINHDSSKTRDIINGAVKGTKNIDSAIKELNSLYDGYIKFMKNADGFDANNYIVSH